METIGNIPKTGIGMIDAEHLRLINLANMLLHLIVQHKFSSSSGETIVEKLDEVLFHMEAHCKNEEELMRGVSYPDYDNHKFMHDDVLIKFNKAHNDFASHQNYNDLANFISTILSPWLLTHASKDDMAMAEYLRSRVNSD